MRSCITSKPFVGVDLMVGVIVTAASLFSPLSLSQSPFRSRICPQTNEAYVSFGLIITVNSHLARKGFGPHRFFIMFEVNIRVVLHCLSTCSKCGFQVSFSSIVTPRYLILSEKGTSCPSTIRCGGSLVCGIFHLWKITTTVLSELNVKPYSLPHVINSLIIFCRDYDPEVRRVNASLWEP